MASPKKESTQPEQSENITLDWGSAENLPTIYANQLIISHSGPEFYLVFGEVMTPALSGDPFSKTIPTHLTVRPVARIAVNPSVMVEMEKVIHDNVTKFMKLAQSMFEEQKKMEQKND